MIRSLTPQSRGAGFPLRSIKLLAGNALAVQFKKIVICVYLCRSVSQAYKKNKMRSNAKQKVAILLTTCTVLLSASFVHGYQATFTPRISINENYTGNVFFTNEDQESDFITVVSPGFTLEASERSKGVSISYDAGFSYYNKNNQNNTVRHNARLAGWTNLSKITRLEFYDTFQRTEEPFADTAETDLEEIAAAEDTTRRTGRQPYYTNDLGFNLTHQIGKSDSLTLGYVYSILENEDPTVEDNASHNPSIGFSHRFSPYLDIGTNFAYTKGEFDTSDNFDQWEGSLRLNKRFTEHLGGFLNYSHTIMDFKGESEDYQIYDPSIGINYTITEETTFSLGVGYFVQDRELSEDEANFSINGDIGLAWQLRRGSINLSVSSGYDQSYFGAENLGYYTFSGIQGAVNYGLSKSLTGNISASYRENDYANLTPNRKDRIGQAGFGLTFNPLTITWLSIGLHYSYRTHNSTLDANDFVEDSVQFNISISPSQPIRLN